VYVGPIIVYVTTADVPNLPEEEAVGIAFLKEQQWAVPFATVEATVHAIARSIDAIGEVIPTAGGYAAVAAPVDGIVRADAGRSGPVPGQWVEEGQVLTVLSPVSAEDGYAPLLASAERLEREVKRAERLLALEAIPARRLEELQHDLDVTNASLDAMGGSRGEDYEFAVRAPISGFIDERHVVVGARVSAGDPLFSIVDTRLVWVRLDVSSTDAARASDAAAATFSVEGTDKVYRSDRVISVGRVIDATLRTLPVLVQVVNTDQSLKVGMLAHGRVLLGDPVSGVAIPSAAVREEDGLFVAYVHIGGESFERRALALGPTDDQWTIVLSGVRRGERVVTVGAYQVKLSSLNTNAISDHGHPH
jgi:RND family efflux transporter MFP subunit